MAVKEAGRETGVACVSNAVDFRHPRAFAVRRLQEIQVKQFLDKRQAEISGDEWSHSLIFSWPKLHESGK